MIEMLIEYRGALIAVLVALIGILGAFSLQRYIAIRNAVHAYKSAFTDCSAAIANNVFAIDTFINDFNRHKAAVDAIRQIIPKRHQRKLQKAWNEYCGKDSGIGFDAKEYVQAINATIHSTDMTLFNDFKTKFNALHGCLNDLL